MNVQEFLNRAANWNAARYPQEYNKTLQLDLLKEELQEFKDAEYTVDKLDALCDVAFVAAGGIWKCGLQVEDNLDLLQVSIDVFNEARQVKDKLEYIEYFISEYELNLKPEAEHHLAINLGAMNFAISTMEPLFGFTADDVLKALFIVCDSNDSKSVQKTAANVKANIDKGEGFIQPEPRLSALLETVGHA